MMIALSTATAEVMITARSPGGSGCLILAQWPVLAAYRSYRKSTLPTQFAMMKNRYLSLCNQCYNKSVIMMPSRYSWIAFAVLMFRCLNGTSPHHLLNQLHKSALLLGIQTRLSCAYWLYRYNCHVRRVKLSTTHELSSSNDYDKRYLQTDAQSSHIVYQRNAVAMSSDWFYIRYQHEAWSPWPRALIYRRDCGILLHEDERTYRERFATLRKQWWCICGN